MDSGVDDLRALRAAFLGFDSRQDGVISLEELRLVLRRRGADAAEVNRLFASMDQDRYAEVKRQRLRACGTVFQVHGVAIRLRIYGLFHSREIPVLVDLPKASRSCWTSSASTPRGWA